MPKLLNLSLILCLVSSTANTQTLTWANKIGGGQSDIGYKSVVDGNGNIYLTGSFQGLNVDFDPSPSTYTLSSAGAKDAFVAKYDVSGNFLWAFKIGGAGLDDVNDIVLDQLGNLIITGYFRGAGVDFNPSAGSAILNSNGESGGDPGYGGDVFVAQYDISGNYKWAFNVGGTALGENGLGVGVDNNNNVLVTGYFNSAADFDPSSATTIRDGSNAPIFIAKYTSAGVFQWVVTTGQAGVDNTGFDITADNLNNVIVTGFFQGSNIDFDPSTATNTLSSTGGFEYFVAQYSAAGQYRWARSAGGSGADVGRSLTIDLSNNIYVTGDYNSTNINFAPSSAVNNIINKGANDIFLVKYTSTGQHLWSFGVGGPSVELGWHITNDTQDNILLSGVVASTNADFDPSTGVATISSAGDYDALVAKYTVAGEYVCAFNIGGSGSDIAYGVSSLGNEILITGKFNGSAVDFNPGSGTFPITSSGDDVFFAKYNWSLVQPSGTITGSTVCPGVQAQMTFTATAGIGPFTIKIADGTNEHTYRGIISGVPFNLTYSPLQTTTYSLVSIKDGANCSAPAPGSGTAAIIVFCSPEICNNGLDDDADGLIDCADPDCLSCLNTCGPVATLNPKIFNTGNNGSGGLINVGVNDRHWTVSNTLNGTPRNTIYTGNCVPGFWTPTPFADAGWITDKQLGTCGTITPQNDSSKRFFTTSFMLPASLVSSLRLSFDVYADNYIGEVYVNNIPQGISNTTRDLFCSGCNISFTLSSGFVAGTNTITVLVLQMPIPELPAGNQKLGLLVNASASLDSDGDGVVDGLDICPGTPAGIVVSPAGCFDIIITANTPLCAGDSLVIESSAAGTGSVFEWTTPSGNILLGKRVVLQNVDLLNQGKYHLKITDVYNCIHRDSVDVIIKAKPIIIVSPGANICKGTSTLLTATGGVQYQWSPAASLNNSSIASPQASPLSTTIYQVLVTNSDGCKDSTTTTVSVDALSISTSGDAGVCRGDSVQLNAGGGATYQWSPATGLSNPSIPNPKASPASATLYKVLVTAINGCKDSANITLAINPPPFILITADSAICRGDTIQLNASGGTGYQWNPVTALSNAGIANPKAAPLITTIYKVLVTTANGCIDSASTTITIKPTPIVTVSAPATICAGDSLLLSALGGVTYAWSPATGLSNPLIQYPLASPGLATTYMVTATNAAGCQGTATTTISVRPKPVLNLGRDTALCSGQNIIFNASLPDGASYLWNTGLTTPDIRLDKPGVYSVIVQTAGCTTLIKDTIQLGIDFPPSVAIGPDAATCAFNPVLVRAEGTFIKDYLWSNGSTDSSIFINTEGLHFVIVNNRCGSAKDEIYVKINDCPDELFFPSAFTPNGDGLNESFKAAYFPGVPVFNYELKVFNRWGETVFATNDISKGWNGIYKQQLQATHTFVWYARYRKTVNGTMIFKKGTVTLIR